MKTRDDEWRDGSRSSLSGRSGREPSMMRQLRLVYDRDSQKDIPDEFQKLLDQLD